MIIIVQNKKSIKKKKKIEEIDNRKDTSEEGDICAYAIISVIQLSNNSSFLKKHQSMLLKVFQSNDWKIMSKFVSPILSFSLSLSLYLYIYT